MINQTWFFPQECLFLNLEKDHCEGSWPATSPFLLQLILAVIQGSSRLILFRHHVQSITHPLLTSLWNFKCRRCRIRNMLDAATGVRLKVCWWQNNSIFDSLICPLLFFSDGQEQKESECRAFCPLHKVCQKTWHPPPETIKRKSNISRVVMSHNLIYITKKKSYTQNRPDNYHESNIKN